MTAKVCIYCQRALHEQTRWAHVWPRSMGGRLRSREICCDDCNNELGDVEDEVRGALLHANAALAAKRDDGSDIAVSVNIEGMDFELAGGLAALQAPGAGFDRATKSMIVPLPAGRENQVEALARAMRSHGISPDDVAKLDLVDAPPPTLPPSGFRPVNVSLGGEVAHKRVFAKMALELLAYFRHELANRGALSEARRFVRRGLGTLQSKADLKSEGSGLLEGIDVPELWNAVEVWTFGTNVFFRVVFLRFIRFTGTLATNWDGPPFRAVYAFDARDPAAVVAKEFRDGAGPNLAVWLEGHREDAAKEVARELEEASVRLRDLVRVPQQENPPPIDELRQQVRERLTELGPRKKGAKRSRKETPPG